jgi:hypothetical protein
MDDEALEMAAGALTGTVHREVCKWVKDDLVPHIMREVTGLIDRMPVELQEEDYYDLILNMFLYEVAESVGGFFAARNKGHPERIEDLIKSLRDSSGIDLEGAESGVH